MQTTTTTRALINRNPSMRVWLPALLAFGLIGISPFINATLLFSQDFESGSMGPTNLAGTTYENGSPTWSIAQNGANVGLTQFSAGTAASGWTANTSDGYVFGDGTGNNSTNATIFRAQGWNAGADTLLQVDLKFAVAGQAANYWGALILSSSTFTDTTLPGAGAQNVHIRFNKNGQLDFSDNTQIGSTTFALGADQINTLRVIYNGSSDAFDGIASNQGRILLNGNTLFTGDISHLGGSSGAAALDLIEFRSFGSLGHEAGGPAVQAWFDDVSVTVIPEPGTLVLLGISLGALALFRRRKA
ncbi:MAG: PEP-CTERM sorting domain-containing protein [Verrucomicrobia bacterium]|nr:PEP-CTERM sorting domain-containing protein [Verrucomicrobiota bacterium]